MSAFEDSPCVEWVGAKSKGGYGLRSIAGKLVYVHRLAYAEKHGLDVHTMGGVVRHACDNPACYNADHLTLGTHLENMHDKIKRGRQYTKLTPDDVVVIKAVYVKGDRELGGVALARRYGVHSSLISLVISNKAWVMERGAP